MSKDKQEEANTIIGGDATRGKASHNNFVGKYNPSYALCKAKDGHVYGKFVGSPYDYVEIVYLSS